MTEKLLLDVPTVKIWQICSAFEAAHEYEDIEAVKRQLSEWGITYEEGIKILEARGVL